MIVGIAAAISRVVCATGEYDTLRPYYSAMNNLALNEQLRLATLERIASYTVGIALEKNSRIGTGTLIIDGKHKFILTAAHVVEGTDTRLKPIDEGLERGHGRRSWNAP